MDLLPMLGVIGVGAFVLGMGISILRHPLGAAEYLNHHHNGFVELDEFASDWRVVLYGLLAVVAGGTLTAIALVTLVLAVRDRL